MGVPMSASKAVAASDEGNCRADGWFVVHLLGSSLAVRESKLEW